MKILFDVQIWKLKRNWNYFEKSATKQGFYSLYGVKLRKSKLFWKQVIKSRFSFPIWCESRKVFQNHTTNSLLLDSVMQKEEKSFKKMSENHIKRTVFYEKRKNYRPFVFKYFVRVECWCKKEEIICYFLILYSNRY